VTTVCKISGPPHNEPEKKGDGVKNAADRGCGNQDRGKGRRGKPRGTETYSREAGKIAATRRGPEAVFDGPKNSGCCGNPTIKPEEEYGMFEPRKPDSQCAG